MRHFIVISLFVVSCTTTTPPEKVRTAATNPQAMRIRLEVFNNADIKNNPTPTGFGYRIYVDGTLRVEQPNIPAAPGNSGFQTKEDAFITATLVKSKIEQGLMPPSITIAELDSMRVKY